jgi:hypothetical protein
MVSKALKTRNNTLPYSRIHRETHYYALITPYKIVSTYQSYHNNISQPFELLYHLQNTFYVQERMLNCL